MFVLLHSPLVGPLTWRLTASALQAAGARTLVPDLSDNPDSPAPYWQQHAAAAASAMERVLAGVPADEPVVLAGHSGAGMLLPAVRQALGRPVAGYLFVDAGLPRPGLSRLATFGDQADEFRHFLEGGGRFPTWTAKELGEIIPDRALAAGLAADMRPRGLRFWQESIPAFVGWPDAPCAYVLFSDTYRAEAERASQAGWPVRELAGGHFHMLVDPGAVAQTLLELAEPWLG